MEKEYVTAAFFRHRMYERYRQWEQDFQLQTMLDEGKCSVPHIRIRVVILPNFGRLHLIAEKGAPTSHDEQSLKISCNLHHFTFLLWPIFCPCPNLPSGKAEVSDTRITRCLQSYWFQDSIAFFRASCARWFRIRWRFQWISLKKSPWTGFYE